MEENINSIKENKSNDEEALKNVPRENSESISNENDSSKNVPKDNAKDQSQLINVNTEENVVNPNNQNITKAISNEINNKKLEASKKYLINNLF